MKKLNESKIGERGVLYCRLDRDTLEIVKLEAIRQGINTSALIKKMILFAMDNSHDFGGETKEARILKEARKRLALR